MTAGASQDDFDAFLDALSLGDDALTRTPIKRIVCIPSGQERKVARFAEITAFVRDAGRHPDPRSHEAAERALAASLKGFRSRPADLELLSSFDDLGVLGADPHTSPPLPATLDELLGMDDPLLADRDGSLFAPLPNVPEERETDQRRNDDRVAPDKIAERRRCLTFDVWRPVFAKIAGEVNSGVRRVTRTGWTMDVKRGNAFVVNGHVAVVAEINMIPNGAGERQPRLRVIYDNGTESDHLLASFAKVLNADPNARRIGFPDGAIGGLFEAPIARPADHIYVARTLSTHPELVELAPHILKIGRTGADVDRRLAAAAEEATFLYAPVRVVATYAVRGFDVRDVEKALHDFFSEAAVRVSTVGGLGRRVDPREWFMTTPTSVDRAIQLMTDRRLGAHRYEPDSDRIIEIGS